MYKKYDRTPDGTLYVVTADEVWFGCGKTEISAIMQAITGPILSAMWVDSYRRHELTTDMVVWALCKDQSPREALTNLIKKVL